MLTMRELAPVDAEDTAGPLVTVTDGAQTMRYRTVAAHFEDTTTFFPMLGEYEVWQLINLTGDTHPIHLHLDPFQILSRRADQLRDPGRRHRGPSTSPPRSRSSATPTTTSTTPSTTTSAG